MLNNKEEYKKIFIETLELDKSKFKEDIKYNDVPEWDSIGHMTLISAIEEKYNIAMDTDDVIDFSSYARGIEILKNKHGINFG